MNVCKKILEKTLTMEDLKSFQFRPEEQSQEIVLESDEEIESFQPVKTEEIP